MGTTIVCVIPKDKQYPIDKLKKKLEHIFNNKCKAEYLYIKKNGRFTKDENVCWWIRLIPSNEYNPEYITGEGSSFSIDIYKKVMFISCIERFSSLYLDGEHNLREELYKIFSKISDAFGLSDKMLLAAGGFGETDIISDTAYYENADFDQICETMIRLNGPPATNLDQLTERCWYLRM